MLNTCTRWRLGAASLVLGLALGVSPAAWAKHSAKHHTTTHTKTKAKAKSHTHKRKHTAERAQSDDHKTRHAGRKAKTLHQQTGSASWYGGRFHGRRTASGERFNKLGMTAAHKTIPFGTWVEVTLLRTGRSVRVRINDRGPYVRGRVIDLSRGSARQLGIHGVSRVRLNWPVTPPKKHAAR